MNQEVSEDQRDIGANALCPERNITTPERLRFEEMFPRKGKPWDFESGVSDAELLRQNCQSQIGCPQFQASN
jgi:hypothetical protein